MHCTIIKNRYDPETKNTTQLKGKIKHIHKENKQTKKEKEKKTNMTNTTLHGKFLYPENTCE